MAGRSDIGRDLRLSEIALLTEKRNEMKKVNILKERQMDALDWTCSSFGLSQEDVEWNGKEGRCKRARKEIEGREIEREKQNKK